MPEPPSGPIPRSVEAACEELTGLAALPYFTLSILESEGEQSPAALMNGANAALVLGDFAKAAALAIQAWHFGSAMASLAIASTALTELQALDDLQELLNNAVPAGQEDEAVLARLKGLLAADRGMHSEALELLRIASAKGDARSLLEIAELLHEDRQECDEDVYAAYQLSIDAEIPEAGQRLALALLGGTPSQSLDALLWATWSVARGSTDAVVPAAQALAELGHDSRAEALFLDAYRLHAQDSAPAYLQFLLMRRRSAEALTFFEMASGSVNAREKMILRELLADEGNIGSYEPG